jgi:hypothetical protein
VQPLSPLLFLTAARSLARSRDSWRKLSDTRSHGDSLVPSIREQDRLGDSTDMATFIAHVGYTSHPMGDGGTCWPFPLVADCDRLGALAKLHNIIRVGTPEAGDLYLRAGREGRFTRASIVLTAVHTPHVVGPDAAYDCTVLEGAAQLVSMTNRMDPKIGRVATSFNVEIDWVRKTRVWAVPVFGDLFVAWVDLDKRDLVGTAVEGQAA